ncbi:MAG: SRPBCC domain-containing protein [Caulobacterales bacterium]
MEIKLETLLAGGPDDAFRAWTQAGEITRWWGEDGVYRTVAWAADVEAGGAWRADFADHAGDAFSAEGRYIEALAPERLVWTWSASWSPDISNTIDMTFTAEPDGTRLQLRNFGFSSLEECEEAREGWTQILGWLAVYLADTAED